MYVDMYTTPPYPYIPELLRCFAESRLLGMVQMLFSRLHTLSEVWEGGDDGCSVDQTLHCEEGTGEEQNHTTSGEENSEDKGTVPEAPPTEEVGEDRAIKQAGDEELDQGPPVDTSPVTPVTPAPEKQRSVTPYGLPCMRELLRFLTSIINSRDKCVLLSSCTLTFTFDLLQTQFRCLGNYWS